MKAMILKEFRQMRRDRRAVALMVGMPLMLLVIFGYAARFDITEIRTAVVGPGAVTRGLSTGFRRCSGRHRRATLTT